MDAKELRFEIFRTGTLDFHGEPECGIKVTHLPSGLFTFCGEFKSLIQNKAKALRELDALIQEQTTNGP